MDKFADTNRFYQLLDRLDERVGGARHLINCTGRMSWPQRGVYFFFEAGELRSGSETESRVVRVGTHGLIANSQSTLWKRLSQHRGSKRGGGNHRGSIFRLLVGRALARHNAITLPKSWGIGADSGTAARRMGVSRNEIKEAEAELEFLVSRCIGNMPFLWLNVDDEPGSSSQRGFIERNAIALLSAFYDSTPNPASENWVGHFSDRERVRRSGLWNNRHVDEDYTPSFLNTLESWIARTT